MYIRQNMMGFMIFVCKHGLRRGFASMVEIGVTVLCFHGWLGALCGVQSQAVELRLVEESGHQDTTNVVKCIAKSILPFIYLI